ncbi:MAG: histidinol dehydrogenase, partial [Chitinophagaceae bacterium]
MIPTQRIFIEPRKEIWFDLLKRPQIETQQLEGTVSAILDDVKKRGDDAIKEYTYKFDKRTLSELQVGREAIQSSEGEISTALKDAIQLAASNIRKFHEAQRENFQKIETSPGVNCWRKAVPIQRVG